MNEGRIAAHVTARVLITRGMRVPIVAHITGLSAAIVRQVYREVTGEVAKPGPTPAIMSLVETNAVRAATSMYVVLYAHYAPNTVKRMEVGWREALMAYDTFLRVTPKRFHVLNINGAWRAATGFRSGELTLHRCDTCDTQYVACDVYDRRAFVTCPICSLTESHGRKSARKQKTITAS